jgi:hypothetical protein
MSSIDGSLPGSPLSQTRRNERMTTCMSHRNRELLQSRLEEFRFDSGQSRFGFADRLARENGWTEIKAEKTIREYKRFLGLAMTAGHPVTPSEDVDQVWHLHLTYTESYWNALCRDLLGSPLHHHPTQGGSDERAKFHDWYARTLESYVTAYGESPPQDVWPGPHERFRHMSVLRWVDTSAHWVINRSKFLRQTFSLILVCLCLGVMLGAAPDAVHNAGSAVLVIAVGLLAILLSAAFGGKSGGKSKKDKKSDTSGCGGCDSGDAGCGDGGCGGCGCGGCGCGG